jgi:hypothetical protein
MRKNMRSSPARRVSLDKLNRLINTQNNFYPNSNVSFKNGDDLIYDDNAEDMKYFYRNLGIKLGYSREYTGNRETSFIDYDIAKNIQKAKSRQQSFCEKEN